MELHLFDFFSPSFLLLNVFLSEIIIEMIKKSIKTQMEVGDDAQ